MHLCYKVFLLIIIHKITQTSAFKCKTNSTFECYKQLIEYHGAINIVFCYKYLKGPSSNSSNTFEIFNDPDKVFEKPILLIEREKILSKFEIKIPVEGTYLDFRLLYYTQIPLQIDDKFYNNEICSSNVETFAWVLKKVEEIFIIFYACHVKLTKNGISMSKKIIFMVETSRDLNDINKLIFEEKFYDGNFSSLEDFKGERFCMCEKLFSKKSKNNFEIDNKESALGWGIVIFIFISIFFVLYLIYACLVEEKIKTQRGNKSGENKIRKFKIRRSKITQESKF